MTAVRCVLFCVHLAAVWLVVSGQNAPLSPCPKVFKYENDGMLWYGTVKVPPPFGIELRLDVHLSIGAKLPSKYVGNIELVGERGRILLNILNSLPITYKVNFPILTPISKVTKIVFNDRILCQGQKENTNIVTSVVLNHVLKTSEGANNTQNVPDDSMDVGSRPNPGNFAKPRPTKPPKQNNKPQVADLYVPDNSEESQFSNDVNHPIRPQESSYENSAGQDTLYYGTETTSRPSYVQPPKTKPKPPFVASQSRPNKNNFESQQNQDTNYYEINNANKPQQEYGFVSQSIPASGEVYGEVYPPNNDGNGHVITKPIIQTRPTIPVNSQRPQQPINSAITNNFDSYHNSLMGTSNVLPNPSILGQTPISPPQTVIKPGDPLYNYHISQDKNVTQTDVFHGTPENANSNYNYFYHETNKTISNRFSYEYTHQSPVYVQVQQSGQPPYLKNPMVQPILQNPRPMWKGSEAETQELRKRRQQNDGVQIPMY